MRLVPQIEDWLRARDVRVPPRSRLQTAATRVRAIDDKVKRGDTVASPDRRMMLESLRTLLDSTLIWWTATRSGIADAQQAFPRDRLRWLVRGAETTALDRDPRPRSMQFELVTGATLLLSGLVAHPVEPDYESRLFDERIGVPAKRIQSVREPSIRALVKDAARQLRRARVRGLLALGVDSLVQVVEASSAEEKGGKLRRLMASAETAVQTADHLAIVGCLYLATGMSYVGEAADNRITLQVAVFVTLFLDELPHVSPEDAESAREGIQHAYTTAIRRLADDLR